MHHVNFLNFQIRFERSKDQAIICPSCKLSFSTARSNRTTLWQQSTCMQNVLSHMNITLFGY